MAEGAKIVKEWEWSKGRAQVWFSPDQLSYRGFCAWNHDAKDLVTATRIVVTESASGAQESRACCEECYESVLRYVGGAAE